MLAFVQAELQASYTRYRLQKLQNKAGRIITGENYDMSATTTRLKLGWKDLQTRRDEQMLSFVQKIVAD